MKKIWLLLVVSFLLSCKSDDELPPKSSRSYEPVSKGEIIKHAYYTLAYSEDHEQAYWVYYNLSGDLINGPQDRTDDFRADPSVSTGSASLNDYKGSGYDRGHLCPAADMTLNRTSMSESFYLSNMSPQLPGFNRGIWSTLEDQVREWALEKSMIYVVTGPIFKNNKGVIGENEVTVPGYYYKVLFDGKNRMIGFILPNESSPKSLNEFVVTVNEIEQQTGIDFFSGIDDQLENQLEESINITEWNF